jgi:hypothetical protein
MNREENKVRKRNNKMGRRKYKNKQKERETKRDIKRNIQTTENKGRHGSVKKIKMKQPTRKGKERKEQKRIEEYMKHKAKEQIHYVNS